VWSPRGHEGSSGFRARIRGGVKTVAGRVKKLRATVTTDAALTDLLSVLLTDSQGFITELCEFVSSQYDEYVESSSFTAEEAWSLVIDCVAHIFEELHSARSVVMDAVQYNQCMHLWGFIKAWERQERYRANEFKNYPALTGLMVRRIMMHDGERTLKQQLTQLTTHGDKIDDLYTKIGDYHKEDLALQKKVKALAGHVNLPKQKLQRETPQKKDNTQKDICVDISLT
jgi:hypothetical protein